MTDGVCISLEDVSNQESGGESAAGGSGTMDPVAVEIGTGGEGRLVFVQEGREISFSKGIVQEGCEISFSVAVDFTGSNGNPALP